MSDLLASSKALLDLDADGALVPHGLGGHGRSCLTWCVDEIERLRAALAAEREACARIADERFDTETSICKHCGEPIALRNPSGHCDHLFWPDNLSAAALVANGLASNADEPIECHQDGLDYELRVLFGGLGCRVVAQADDGSRLELPYMSADQARVLAAKLRTAADELDVF